LSWRSRRSIHERESLIESGQAKDVCNVTFASRDLEAIPVACGAAARLKDRVESSRIEGGQAIHVEQDPVGTARLGLGKHVPQLEAGALFKLALDSDPVDVVPEGCSDRS
jgi:hypothetical protein